MPERLAEVKPSWVVKSDPEQIAQALIEALAFDGRTNGADIARRDLDGRLGAQQIVSFYRAVLDRIPRASRR